jgi:hypothetical protein
MTPITYVILFVALILSLIVVQTAPIPVDMKPMLIIIPFMIVMFMWLLAQANQMKKKK